MAREQDSLSYCRVTYIEKRFDSIFAREKLQPFLDGAGIDATSVLSEKLPNGKRVALVKVRGEWKCVGYRKAFVILEGY